MTAKTTVLIKLPGGTTGFAEDKDEARRIRLSQLIPALEEKCSVTLDFVEVSYSTQSFIHALLGEALRRFGEDVLRSIEFKNCTPQIKSLVQLVVDYSLGGFTTDENGNLSSQSVAPKTATKRHTRKKKK